MIIDPSNTWRLVEQEMNAETHPRRRRNLELVLAHMKCEARADVEGVVATLTESPQYIIHSNPGDRDMNPAGSKDAVRGFYDRTIVQTGAHHLEFACDRVIADDHSVFTEGIMRQVYPGATLRAMEVDVDDPDAYYFTEYRMGVVWPVDHDEDRLTGEEVYAGGDPFEGIAQRKIALSDIKAI